MGWVQFTSNSRKNDAQEDAYYLPQINISTTSTAVVRKTLRRAQAMTAECNMTSISVTYHLAITKIALEIQAEKRPKYDNIFIAPDAFHIGLSVFGVLGKYIAESGDPYLLNECSMIEKGSISSFLSGNAYKRSKRLQQLLALAMKILNSNSYQLILEGEGLLEREELKTLILSNEIQSIDKSSIPEKFAGIFDKYESYGDKTGNGRHGKTAQFWFAYVEMIQLSEVSEWVILTYPFTVYIIFPVYS